MKSHVRPVDVSRRKLDLAKIPGQLGHILSAAGGCGDDGLVYVSVVSECDTPYADHGGSATLMVDKSSLATPKLYLLIVVDRDTSEESGKPFLAEADGAEANPALLNIEIVPVAPNCLDIILSGPGCIFRVCYRVNLEFWNGENVYPCIKQLCGTGAIG